MEALGRILIADDEDVFLDSTADLLRDEGYHCDCVGDGPSAAEILRQGEYDVLIADIKMPGNPNLELVQQAGELADGLTVILVTGYPSMESAIKSVSLPVSAYLVKPVDFDDLRSSVRSAVERAKIYRAVKDTENHLKEWLEKISGMQELLRHEPGDTDPISVETFVNTTLHNVVLSLTGLKNVTEAVARLTGEQNVCRLVDCPRLDTLIAALRDTIAVLERTKNAFKSKELGELRRRLEKLVQTGKTDRD
jgi:YesN/AraC family two-component response regulator